MSDVFAKAELLAVDSMLLAFNDADSLIANFESLFPGFTELERWAVFDSVRLVVHDLRASNRLSLLALAIAYAAAINGVIHARKVSRQQGH